MQAIYELDKITTEQTVVIDDDGNTTTFPVVTIDTAGAAIRRWGVRSETDTTMTVWIDADEAELAKLPAERRRD